MQYDVLFFGALSELEECGKLTVTDGPPNLTELRSLLCEKHPDLKSQTFRMAVNQQISDGDCVLNEGDEIALLPPFAGG